MPSDLTIAQAGASGSGASTPVPSASTAPPVPGPHKSSGPGLPNPTLQLDPALGIVIIQFHSEDGGITTSIPTAQKLQAYQSGQATQPSSDPAATAPIANGTIDSRAAGAVAAAATQIEAPATPAPPEPSGNPGSGSVKSVGSDFTA